DRGGRLEGLVMQVIRRAAGAGWAGSGGGAVCPPPPRVREKTTRPKSPPRGPPPGPPLQPRGPARRRRARAATTPPPPPPRPKGPTIQLATVVLPATASPRQPDPLFLAQGGPGGSTIETYGTYLLDSPDARPVANRDIVLWDQRGTLYSKPALMCPELSKQAL